MALSRESESEIVAIAFGNAALDGAAVTRWKKESRPDDESDTDTK